jgi:REase_MTES_1575
MSIESVAARQHGLVTIAQAREYELTAEQVRVRLARGQWERVRYGVYVVAGTPPTWEQAVLAAVLGAGDGTVASHRTAGALWELPGFDREDLEISSERCDQRRLDGVVTHRTNRFLAEEHTRVRRIPVTSPERTLVDVSGRLSVAQLGRAVDDSIRRGILQLEILRRCAAGLRPAPGRHTNKITAVLARRLPGYDPGESGLQMRFARGLVQHGCPEPVIEHPVRLNGKRYRIDLAYPELNLAVEVDGWEWHRTRSAFDRDRARANDLVVAGWTVLRFTSTMTDSDAAEAVGAALVRLSVA